MENPEMVEFLRYVDDLIAATSSGAIEWTRANPTTVIWETRSTAPARISLQLVDSLGRTTTADGRIIRKRERSYLLQLTDLRHTPPRQRLSVSGADEPAINERLRRLYDTAASGLSKKGLEFLREILPPRTQ